MRLETIIFTTVEAKPLAGIKIAVLTGEGFHDGELYFPIGYFSSRGAEVCIVGDVGKHKTAYNSSATVCLDKTIDEITNSEIDVLIIPGGEAPESLRKNDKIINFVGNHFSSGKITAAICHGPLILIDTKLMSGHYMTGYPEIENEIKNSGALWVDSEVEICHNLVTSRDPDDLPGFCAAIEEKILRTLAN